MADETIVLRVSGAAVLAALENGVSQFPRLDGRWPCVSGLRFEFDPTRPPGSRVLESSVRIVGGGGAPVDEPLDLDAMYTVATKEYLSNGKDGYTAFKGAEVAVDPENCPMLPVLVRNHFVERAAAVGYRRAGCLSPMRRAKSRMLASDVSATTPAAVSNKFFDASPTDENDMRSINRTQQLPTTPAARMATSALRTPDIQCDVGADTPTTEERHHLGAICPQVEGRIVRCERGHDEA